MQFPGPSHSSYRAAGDISVMIVLAIHDSSTTCGTSEVRDEVVTSPGYLEAVGCRRVFHVRSVGA